MDNHQIHTSFISSQRTSPPISQTLANSLASFFYQKIVSLKESISLKLHGSPTPFDFDLPHSGEVLSDFLPGPVTPAEVSQLLRSMSNKSSPLDYILTSLLKSCANTFPILISHMANLSFTQATFQLKIWGFTSTLTMSFDKQVSETCKACFFHIRALHHIQASLTTEASKTIVAPIVGSRLDFCNSLLAGISDSNLACLQLIQNTLARVVAQKSRFCRITPVLSDLHWLPVRHS